MIEGRELHVKKVESVQIGNQILYEVNGGQDTSCTLLQWSKDWMLYNKYSVAPNASTSSNRLFAIEFDVEFE